MSKKIVNKHLEHIIDQINSKKCKKTFKRYQQEKFKRLGNRYKKPTGIDNRMRKCLGSLPEMAGKRHMTDPKARLLIHLVTGNT